MSLTQKLIGSIVENPLEYELLRVDQLDPKNVIEYVLWVEADNPNRVNKYMSIPHLVECVLMFKRCLSEGCHLEETPITIEIMHMIMIGIVTYKMTLGGLVIAISDSRYKHLLSIFRGTRVPNSPIEKKMQLLFITHISESLQHSQNQPKTTD